MTEEQLAALVPEMVVKVNQPKEDCSDYALIARATAEWNGAHAHLGRAPRYYEDIFPIVERMMKEKAIA